MFTRTLTIGSILFGLLFCSSSAWAASSTLEGIVKDPKGQAIGGAEVRIEAKDGNMPSKIVKTDGKGHYVCTGLPAATYKVILFVNGSMKASITNAITHADKSTQLNFELKGQASVSKKPAKKGTHMVYVPAETGSHLGGRWVEVNDNDSNEATMAGSNRVEKVDGSAINAVLRTR